MIHIGERIQWGSETALMYEAADYIDAVKEPLYTMDELVGIGVDALDAAGFTRNEYASAAIINALLATGQLKVRD